MKPIISKARQNLRETKKQVFLQTATLVNSAFAFVAALAWNEAIKDLINRYVPAGSTLMSKLIYAIIVTLIVVIVSMRLSKIIAEYKPEENE